MRMLASMLNALFEEKNVVSIEELFRKRPKDVPLKICAPMVRYSKLAFRTLVRKYGCDVACTPMIVSDSFVRSKKARDVAFTTHPGDRPLVVQLAASTSEQFAAAAELVAPYCDAVDLNCGCPQRWAMAEGYGAHLIDHVDLLADMVQQAKRRSSLPVSIKIRIHSNLKETVELVRRAEHAGVSWLTVHGRTVKQRTEPVSLEAIKLVKESVGIPVIANGDIFNLKDVAQVHSSTGVDGVMCARGMLQNPAMFSGCESTPKECIKDWVDLALTMGVPFSCFHHHLIYMMEQSLPKYERLTFNSLPSTPAVLDYLQSHEFL